MEMENMPWKYPIISYLASLSNWAKNVDSGAANN
jgi:hypothetical protein